MAIDKITSRGAGFTLIERDGSQYKREINSIDEVVDPVSNMPGVLVAAPSHGARTIIPQNNFIGLVYMWGAGAGIYATYTSSYNIGGYGGYTWGLVKFKKDIPYTLITGQKGTQNFDSNTTVGAVQGGRPYGGGGRGHGSGSSGGGLSGIFYNAQNHAGPNSSVWPPTGVSQASALMIAGGGGGGGHGSNSHHGVGGSGGGWSGGVGHSQARASQTGGGSWWTTGGAAGTVLQGANANGGGSCGGGGGGWWGGPSGSHSGSHHNGGSGGSGHYANPTSNGGNASLSSDILFAETLSSPYEYSSAFTVSAGQNIGYINPGGFFRGRIPKYNMGAGVGSLSGDTYQTDGNVVIVLPDPRVAQSFMTSDSQPF